MIFSLAEIDFFIFVFGIFTSIPAGLHYFTRSTFNRNVENKTT